ncbi:hypothetical protein O181_071644 [Austropuccinia psidii MF-1]|uniref:Uncharacterized protein n=1 Tax=Austropuccinia psidii MF-1 TaxID=1389203 RepID=A0A9Q3F362_9BASI|nr:hypothetical protein [Austropuccinia psidii MF-1]
MPFKHSPPARQTRTQARAQVVLIKNPRAPADGTPEVPQLRTKFGKGSSIHPGRKRAKKIKFFFRDGEEEGSDGSEGVPAPMGVSQGTGGPPLAQSNQSETSLLVIMQKMTHSIANLQEASSSEVSRPPAFKTPSMKAPEWYYGTQPFKVRS